MGRNLPIVPEVIFGIFLFGHVFLTIIKFKLIRNYLKYEVHLLTEDCKGYIYIQSDRIFGLSCGSNKHLVLLYET